MVRMTVSLLIIVLFGSIIVEGIANNYDNGPYKDSGTFEDYPNMTGNWERAADVDGPLEVDAFRKVYIDHDEEEDVYKSSCNFNSYAESILFTGAYWLYAAIEEVNPNEYDGVFNGPWWDYEANGFREPQADDTPQSINSTSAFSWAKGSIPDSTEQEDDPESSEQPEPSSPSEAYSVYANVPF